ncbi:ataxin-7-like protein 1 [Platysternon megacephalum]|uniref:Ataxin-7-like protein 1 n=1 Tax=Platysternon megacephalum TaxID=55544 RepID=A0A4D9ENW5_9SAUR|nr:ataxin-7-like protein 1 [Platysternon megacephalum]
MAVPNPPAPNKSSSKKASCMASKWRSEEGYEPQPNSNHRESGCRMMSFRSKLTWQEHGEESHRPCHQHRGEPSSPRHFGEVGEMQPSPCSWVEERQIKAKIKELEEESNSQVAFSMGSCCKSSEQPHHADGRAGVPGYADLPPCVQSLQGALHGGALTGHPAGVVRAVQPQRLPPGPRVPDVLLSHPGHRDHAVSSTALSSFASPTAIVNIAPKLIAYSSKWPAVSLKLTSRQQLQPREERGADTAACKYPWDRREGVKELKNLYCRFQLLLPPRSPPPQPNGTIYWKRSQRSWSGSRAVQSEKAAAEKAPISRR